ncbi:DegT/DnrJ/EryC1/StrS family aminotransferase [Polynucleobacter wuianus]|uniref:DegT/DnrJ/EryC1/StrS family aminotransferase n=1 Tax=Polynucleobacter wuianus TaxID=1743168 RepID=UPI001C0C4552|nr:DegT/DnrJ/EryC1/StrS family aminotransferase [Polynucleobacter wuianus]MBU3610979.1 DegT/DnrJ/EryC1/StrS family aminotransferase [Polynucleobacter wuianus]
MSSNKPIYVTSPLLPDMPDLLADIESIFLRKMLSNNGPCLLQLKQELQRFLNLKNLALLNNGTSALYASLLALNAEPGSEIITTPFSFVATAHAITAAGLKPIFVDIDPDTYNIDANAVALAITEKTAAIMPVHVFGNPCDLKGFEALSQAEDIPLIYDAAHGFGVEMDGNSLLQFGDMSILSMHATKVYNTIEGGAISINSVGYQKDIDCFINFGIVDALPKYFGMNLKMSELHAVVGLHNLKKVEEEIKNRKKISDRYLEKLNQIPGFKFQLIAPHVKYNFSYFPIQFTNNLKGRRDHFINVLNEKNIFPRKYFSPLLSDLEMYAVDQSLTQARNVSENILCLPIYSELCFSDVDKISELLIHTAQVLEDV